MGKSGVKIFIILIGAILATVIALVFINRRYAVTVVSIPAFNHPAKQAATSSVSALNPLPSTLNLPVPFTPQAPTGNWDQLHNEACEEAVAIMSSQYYLGNTQATLPASLVENEISNLTNWEDQNFGYHLDTTAAETAQMISQVYNLQTKLLTGFTENQLKQELAQNHLVIVSEFGQALGNPYYKHPGPIHHMLLLKGFDGDNFITNDSGTKNGHNYIYTFQTLYSAAADWDHSTNNVDQTKKIAIVVWQ